MKLISFLFIFLFSVQSLALKLELLGHAEIPNKMKFKGTQVGGLSALHFQADTQTLWALSDDRGGQSEPRIYKLKLKYEADKNSLKNFTVAIEDVVLLKRTTAKNVREVLDLESFAFLPWGNLLIASEGDGNKKPRLMPQLRDVKVDGTFIRNFPIPDLFLPETSGKQKTGVRNNLGFEGMTQIPQKNEWILATEASLAQDQRKDEKSLVRWIQYTMSDAWVIKPAKQWAYSLDISKAPLSFQNGISEILAVNDHQVLVLERRLEAGDGLRCKAQLFLADLKEATDISAISSLSEAEVSDKAGSKIRPASKTLVLDFESLTSKIGKIENFEGMSWGPKLPNGKSTLLLVSDDNFMRDLRTQILIFAVDN